jgi:hypothetical protein
MHGNCYDCGAYLLDHEIKQGYCDKCGNEENNFLGVTRMTREKIVDEILSERFRQDTLAHVVFCEETNTINDYIAYITAYLGRTADKCAKNMDEGSTRTNFVKVAALAVAAIEKIDEENDDFIDTFSDEEE